MLKMCLIREAEDTQSSNRPRHSRGLILLLRFLAEPLTAAQPVAALDGSFVLGYDCSDVLLKEGREPEGHAVNLEWDKNVESDKLNHKNTIFHNMVQVEFIPSTLERLLGV